MQFPHNNNMNNAPYGGYPSVQKQFSHPQQPTNINYNNFYQGNTQHPPPGNFDPSYYQQWYYNYYPNVPQQFYNGVPQQAPTSPHSPHNPYGGPPNPTYNTKPRPKPLAPPADNADCKSLYVGNLDERVSEPLMYEIFSSVGQVESCRLIKDKLTGQSLRYGFVNFFDSHTATLAIEQFNGRQLYGSDMKVNWALTTPVQKEETPSVYHVYVGDLSPEIDDKQFYSTFAPFGVIVDARTVKDQETGKSRGYGFVAFKKRDEAQRAITEMNGEWLGGRPIKCNWANSKGPNGGNINQPSTDQASSSSHNTSLDYTTVVTQATPANTTVYVGNIAGDVTEIVVDALFAPFGVIEELRVTPEKGFAFVRFQSHDAAARAIVGCHGTVLSGKTIKVSWSKERTSDFQPRYN